ncbi:hypothetical protein Nizo2535_1748 [Lactiplantibacillus plantarum]|uniref:DUF2000 domain-containing protein n=1 Tax=Lactiplantibacillus plantarum TaxID=1590 RepID=UPI0007B548B9|nr:DUF2000 domain-containing protein [Lactiplantibacillus plantarum]KZU30991.1 hypothetical protein Nizo2535_1748 [Lactiplantibacillus plantarum]
MAFDTKIKIALRDDLAPWQELNVNSFLVSGIAGTQDIIGEPYQDKDGQEYLPMSQQPIMIHTATKEQLQELVEKALSKDVVMTIYTEELFTTYNDEDNRSSIKSFSTSELNLVGVGMRGKKNHVDKLFKGIDLHK